MSPDERRRQLVGIGLRKFVERPVQDVSLDEVAAEAGVSRGLLFHYFPTKTEFHRAVVRAAARRVLRTVSPDEGVCGDEAVRQLVARFLDQVARRRESYIALVYGHSAVALAADADPAGTLRGQLAAVVARAAGFSEQALPVAHAWVAYVEDRALQWSELPAPRQRADRDPLIEHCVQALVALAAL